MNQTAEDLRAVHDYLVEHGWCQGTQEDVGGEVCLFGAVNAVFYGRAMPSGIEAEAKAASRRAVVVDALTRATGTGRWLADWNDAPERTFDEVCDLILTTAKREETETLA